MLYLIGSTGCSNCMMSKKILDKKGIKYKYFLLNEFNEEDKKRIMDLAQEQGKMSLPLIFKENDKNIYSIKEVI